jgi:hypothetical protein
MTSGISRRLAQLEKATLPADPLPTWVQIIVQEGETEDDVKARYIAEHPGERTPTHWIVIRFVSPSREIQSQEATP